MTDRFTVWVEMRRAYEYALTTMALLGVVSVIVHQSTGQFSKPIQLACEALGIIYYVFAFAFSLYSLYSLALGR